MEAKLKSQSVPRSKKGTTGKALDLKGSQFRGFRGLEIQDVHRLLVELKNSKISLKEMSCECATLKQLQKVQLAFVRGTNSKNWDDACEHFPTFTTAEQLEPFKKLDFNGGKTFPPTFMKFCQRAITAASSAEESLNYNDQEKDTIFCVSHKDYIALFWRERIKEVTPDKFTALWKTLMSSENSFSGFSLSIFDIIEINPEVRKYYLNEVLLQAMFVRQWSADEAKQLLLMVRALNFHVSLQDFTVIFFCPLEAMGDILHAVELEGMVQLAVCSFNDKGKGE